jgi:hypothetical protein
MEDLLSNSASENINMGGVDMIVTLKEVEGDIFYNNILLNPNKEILESEQNSDTNEDFINN